MCIRNFFKRDFWLQFQDPREALILSLKREVSALQNENDHLRTLLNLSGEAYANLGDGKTGAGALAQGKRKRLKY